MSKDETQLEEKKQTPAKKLTDENGKIVNTTADSIIVRLQSIDWENIKPDRKHPVTAKVFRAKIREAKRMIKANLEFTRVFRYFFPRSSFKLYCENAAKGIEPYYSLLKEFYQSVVPNQLKSLSEKRFSVEKETPKQADKSLERMFGDNIRNNAPTTSNQYGENRGQTVNIAVLNLSPEDVKLSVTELSKMILRLTKEDREPDDAQ